MNFYNCPERKEYVHNSNSNWYKMNRESFNYFQDYSFQTLETHLVDLKEDKNILNGNVKRNWVSDHRLQKQQTGTISSAFVSCFNKGEICGYFL